MANKALFFLDSFRIYYLLPNDMFFPYLTEVYLEYISRYKRPTIRSSSVKLAPIGKTDSGFVRTLVFF